MPQLLAANQIFEEGSPSHCCAFFPLEYILEEEEKDILELCIGVDSRMGRYLAKDWHKNTCMTNH
jgi:hypothetical protein